MKIKNLLGTATLITLCDEVDEQMLKALDTGLKEALGKENKAAVIILTSHGGNVGYGEAIAERLELANSLMQLKIIGATFVSSAAVQIFLSLPVSQRFVTKRFELMIHPHKRYMRNLEGAFALEEYQRRLQEELQHAEHGRALENRIFQKLISETGFKKARLQKLYRQSHRFSAKEMVDLKMAAAIVT